MDYIVILKKIEETFIDLGFCPIIINGIKFMRYRECYCKVTFLKDWSAFVIESADNFQDAEKGVLEDGDLYYTDISENELLNQIGLDLKRYYMNN